MLEITVEKEIGEFLKKCREKAKMSQEQLANKLHCERSYISKVESGQHTFPLPFVKKWCEATETMDDLSAFVNTKEIWREYVALKNYYIQTRAAGQFVEMMA